MIALSQFLIVEDELLIAETISQFLEKEGCEKIMIVDSVEDAVAFIESNKVDFVLTDIALGKEKSGIELGNLLNSKYQIPFIYITSHADKAMIDKAKHTRPSAYIVKPFKKEDLLIAIELGLYNSSHAPGRSAETEELIVKEGRALIKLFYDNIMWLESDGNYTTINLKDDKRRVIRQALSDMQEQLPAAKFIRIHKSYLINKLHVTEVKPNSVIIDQVELSVGRAYQQNLTGIFG
ncbi:MAG: response regulator [Bacteroidota bacterium]